MVTLINHCRRTLFNIIFKWPKCMVIFYSISCPFWIWVTHTGLCMKTNHSPITFHLKFVSIKVQNCMLENRKSSSVRAVPDVGISCIQFFLNLFLPSDKKMWIITSWVWSGQRSGWDEITKLNQTSEWDTRYIVSFQISFIKFSTLCANIKCH